MEETEEGDNADDDDDDDDDTNDSARHPPLRRGGAAKRVTHVNVASRRLEEHADPDATVATRRQHGVDDDGDGDDVSVDDAIRQGDAVEHQLFDEGGRKDLLQFVGSFGRDAQDLSAVEIGGDEVHHLLQHVLATAGMQVDVTRSEIEPVHASGGAPFCALLARHALHDLEDLWQFGGLHQPVLLAGGRRQERAADAFLGKVRERGSDGQQFHVGGFFEKEVVG